MTARTVPVLLNDMLPTKEGVAERTFRHASRCGHIFRRPSPSDRYLCPVQRALTLALVAGLPLVLVGCGGGHGKSSAGKVHCGLVTDGTQGGKAVVTYDDQTGVAKMSSAIAAAVTDWNNSGAPVVLKASTQNPALTFESATDQPPLPPCAGSTARTVTVTWNKAFWVPGAGKREVLYPTSNAEHAIGHALGLIPGGKCPALMALKPCPDRATAPDAEQMQVLNKLYAAAPSATPSPSSS